MKKVTILTVLLCTAVLCFSQNLNQKDKADTVEFKSKDNKAINIAKLSDGSHSFFSANGTKLLIKLKNQKVTTYSYYLPDGKPINSAKGLDQLSKPCFVCTTVHYPDGSTQRICSEVSCPTANGINKGLRN